MEELEVIKKVEEPTEWCVGMVVVPKANGKVRISVDLTNLNKSVKRERHLLPAVDQTLAQLSAAQVFSTLDANSGFWQIPLDPHSDHAIWKVLLPAIAVWDHFNFRAFSVAYVQHARGDPRSFVHDGRCARAQKDAGTT